MRARWIAVMVMGMALLGCTEIHEIPVAGSSETGAGSAGSSDGADTTAGSGSSGVIDIDDAPSSSAEAEGDSSAGSGSESSGGGEPLESKPFCLKPGRGLEIPEDETWAEALVEVPAHEGVLGLQVNVRITHPRIADLGLVVRAPDGTAVALLEDPECVGANIDAMFEDQAVQLANDLCGASDVAAIAGSVAALDPLTPLLRTPVGGTWTLEYTDTLPGQAGWLDDVCVALLVEGA